MYEEHVVAKTFPLTIFGKKNGVHLFFNKLCRGIVVVRLCVFYASTCVAQGQHACKQTNLLLSRIFGIGLWTTASVVINLEKILQLMSSCFRENLVVGSSSICQTNQISLALSSGWRLTWNPSISLSRISEFALKNSFTYV